MTVVFLTQTLGGSRFGDDSGGYRASGFCNIIFNSGVESPEFS